MMLYLLNYIQIQKEIKKSREFSAFDVCGWISVQNFILHGLFRILETLEYFFLLFIYFPYIYIYILHKSWQRCLSVATASHDIYASN